MKINIRQPFRVMVAAQGWECGRTYKGRGPNHKGAYTAIKPLAYGFTAWTEDTTAEPHRAGFGSFCFGSIHATRAEVVRQLANPRVHQVQVRTNQDRTLFVYNRRADGRITHCCAAE